MASTKLVHIFTLLFEKLVRTPRTFTPPRAGAKQPERNLSIYRDSPTCPSNLVNFGPETGLLASFCPPPKFSHSEILPALSHEGYITDSGLELGFATHLVLILTHNEIWNMNIHSFSEICHLVVAFQ